MFFKKEQTVNLEPRVDYDQLDKMIRLHVRWIRFCNHVNSKPDQDQKREPGFFAFQDYKRRGKNGCLLAEPVIIQNGFIYHDDIEDHPVHQVVVDNIVSVCLIDRGCDGPGEKDPSYGRKDEVDDFKDTLNFLSLIKANRYPTAEKVFDRIEGDRRLKSYVRDKLREVNGGPVVHISYQHRRAKVLLTTIGGHEYYMCCPPEHADQLHEAVLREIENPRRFL